MEVNKIYCGDCIEVMKTLPDNSVDTVVTDPPYGLEFMGRAWDKFKKINSGRERSINEITAISRGPEKYVAGKPFQEFSYNWATQALRVLKPGGYLLAFGGTRTYHRLVCGIEDAGFEIRDTIMWLYGSGFPKSLDVSKSIDKKAGVEREVIDRKRHAKKDFKDNLYAQDPANANNNKIFGYGEEDITLPATPEAKQWAGWGTALKPACEPIVVARKPLSESTVAENVLKWGTGGIDIDGGRIGTDTIRHSHDNTSHQKWKEQDGRIPKIIEKGIPTYHKGRFPANVILDEQAAAMLDEMSGVSKSSPVGFKGVAWKHSGNTKDERTELKYQREFNDTGGASRFFYCAKASKTERNRGCEGLEEKYNIGVKYTTMAGDGRENPKIKPVNGKNHHPTVKPLALMEYLIKLVSRKGAVILDPFCGSGTTAIGCVNTGRKYIVIDNEKEYIEISKCRVRAIPETLFNI